VKNSKLQSKKAVQKAKEPVRIRFKPLANGNQSIYLDCYRDGQRSYEFLKLYLVPESGHAAKEANAQTLALANAVKAQRVVELQNSAHGFTSSGTRSKAKLVDYILAMAEQKRTNAGGGKRTIAGGYRALAKHVEAYSGTKTTFRQVNKAYCVGFIDHLKAVPNQTTGLLLGTNTQAGYMRMLSTVISAAVADEILDGNPFHQVKPENKPKKHKSEIVYLTAGELQQMESTDYQHASTKHAFLFSCYTGLRWSDVEGLTWGMLQKDNKGGTVISHVQRKTKKQEYLPIPQKAVKLLPDRASAKDTDKVFDLFTSTYVNMQLRVWAALAGVSKHLTFHVARHTYATLLLSLGARIEVISENLGHSEIRTTQAHYAAVENKLQREAVNLLDRLNGLTQ
jgi:integrase